MSNPAADPKNGPRAKIDRAKEHLENFKTGVRDFLSCQPYSCAYQPQPDGSLKFLVKVSEYPSARLCTIAADALQNARSALDLLACQLVRKQGAGVSGVYFPIVNDFGGFPDARAKFNHELSGKVGKADPHARRFIERLKPYQGGNATLVRLQAINNADKHRMLVVIGAAVAAIRVIPSVNARNTAPPPEKIKSAPILQDGQTVLTLIGADARAFHDADEKEMAFEIRLSGVKGLPDKSARWIIEDIVTMVDRIVGIAERKLF